MALIGICGDNSWIEIKIFSKIYNLYHIIEQSTRTSYMLSVFKSNFFFGAQAFDATF